MKQLLACLIGKNAFDRTITTVTVVLSLAAVGLLQWQWARASEAFWEDPKVSVVTVPDWSAEGSKIPQVITRVAVQQLFRAVNQ